MKPAFLITIDTEGDNLWSYPSEITTENSRYLRRFQLLCERYALKPTWLTNWEMVNCGTYRDFAKDCLKRGTAEIGMHLHAWNNPPIIPLSADDNRLVPFLIQFDESIMRDKIAVITDRLEDAFGAKMLSHRAGRWAFNETYARLLVEHGYRIDCSVSPHMRGEHGDPSVKEVADYTNFPESAYWVDLKNIAKEDPHSTLLELPVTIVAKPRTGLLKVAELASNLHSFPRRVLDRFAPKALWLRPDGRNRHAMQSVLDTALQEERAYVEFMLHSSEFMPGGSPRFPTEMHIERLYDDLEALFEHARGRFEGLTLAEYHARLTAGSRRAAA